MATLADQLAEAQAAYHNLVTGRAVSVFVDQNGERIEYVAASAGRLAQYIELLKKQIDRKTRTGPMRVWF